jgi:signal transduction histidine kinase
MQLQCYRIVQEALTNIEKHTSAGEAALTVRNARRVFPGEAEKRNSLLICVSDDGGGFAHNPPQQSLGLRGMYERAALLGAELLFFSEKAQGLTVRLEIPLKTGTAKAAEE